MAKHRKSAKHFGSTDVSAATASSTVPFIIDVPKPRAGNTAYPSFLRTTKVSDAVLPDDDLRLANIDITTLRTGVTTKDTLNKLSKASPDLSAALSAALRMAISSSYTVVARNLDGTLNPDGTRLAQQLCQRFDNLGAYASGFNAFPTIRSASESMGRELLLYGACSAELVLDKARMPQSLLPVSTPKLVFRVNKNRLVPYQVIGADEIALDVPTFFYTSLDQDLLKSYADSPVQASIQPILASQAFMNDLRRIFHRAIHPRPILTINEEKWKKYVPVDVLHDPDKLQAHIAATITDLESRINGLEPEDALVLFDLLAFNYANNGSISLSDEYKTFAKIIDGKMASGTKSMPVVLGHDAAGSTNIASTQSMLFVKTVEGAVQGKLNEIYSRIFTLALRLFGLDVVAHFAYRAIDLRPELELEAFLSMKQERVLEQLSLGFLSDDEASIILTGTLPEPNAPRLSGTMFHSKSSANTDATSPYSNTGALNQTLNSSAPKGVKGVSK